MPTIETERLTLRAPIRADIAALDEMDADPEVMRYIGDGHPIVRTPEESAELFEKMMTRWDERGYGLFVVTSRATGEVLGWVTLAPPLFLPEIMPTVEIGYRFLRRHWGFGYATEAARPVLDYGFTTVGLEQIVSIRAADNAPSGRVAEKIGLHFSREAVVPRNGVRVVVTALERAEYDKARAQAQALS